MTECFLKRRGEINFIPPPPLIIPSEFIFENVSDVGFVIGKSTNDSVYIDYGDGSTYVDVDSAYSSVYFNHNYSEQSTHLVKIWSDNPDCEIYLGGISNINNPNHAFSFFTATDNLISVKTGDNVKRIGEISLSDRNNIRSFEFSPSLHTLMHKGIRGNNNLERVVFQGETPPTVDDDRLFNLNENIETPYSIKNTNLKIYVPDENVSDYQNANNWDNYSDRIFPISSKEPFFFNFTVDFIATTYIKYIPILINNDGTIRLEVYISGANNLGTLTYTLNEVSSVNPISSFDEFILEVSRFDLLELEFNLEGLFSGTFTIKIYNNQTNTLISEDTRHLTIGTI